MSVNAAPLVLPVNPVAVNRPLPPPRHGRTAAQPATNPPDGHHTVARVTRLPHRLLARARYGQLAPLWLGLNSQQKPLTLFKLFALRGRQ